jgi:hypothetical protein
MANNNGNAYGLTLLCPIQPGVPTDYPPDLENMRGQTNSACIRYLLQDVFRVSENSPMARVPNTYLSRFYILQDVGYQGYPAILEHLKSEYMVCEINLHGELEPYLAGMWAEIQPEIMALLRRCWGSETVNDSASFIAYIKKCQIDTTFFFVGSSDESLAVQLKSLYLKQEFSKFVYENQGKSREEIQAAFVEFELRTQPMNTDAPTWVPGAYSLENVVKGAGTA